MQFHCRVSEHETTLSLFVHAHWLQTKTERGFSGDSSSQSKQVATNASNQRPISKTGSGLMREEWNIKRRKTVVGKKN